MIRFELLDKNDLGVLFDGFTTQFLQIPFVKPHRSLEKYIPNGFRADKLTRAQLIKIFTEAIGKRDPAFCEFVRKEIETQFSEAGVDSFVENSRENAALLYGEGLGIVSVLLWENKLRVPVYIAYLLLGLSCSDQFKDTSMKLHNAFFGTKMKKKRKQRKK